MAIVPEQRDYNAELERRSRRRRTNDESDVLTEALPWTWKKTLTTFGISGTIALFLVYQGATRLPKLEEGQIRLEKMLEQQAAQAAQRDAKLDQILRTLQGICVNGAKTDDDRRRCF